MDSYVIYNPDYHVLICRIHQHAIKPSFIERHFREEHSSTDLETRQKIVSYAKALSLVEPNEIRIPQDTPLWIRQIKVEDGWKCSRCSFASMKYRTISEHGRNVHGWTQESENMWCASKVQTFFQGQYKKYILHL